MFAGSFADYSAELASKKMHTNQPEGHRYMTALAGKMGNNAAAVVFHSMKYSMGYLRYLGPGYNLDTADRYNIETAVEHCSPGNRTHSLYCSSCQQCRPEEYL